MLSSNRHALVVAYLALVLALSGTAYAITVDGGDVVNGSLSGKDMKAGSIPEADLNFNAVAVRDISMANVFTETPLTITPQDGPVAIAGAPTTLKDGFDSVYGTATFSVTNDGQVPARIEIRPYVDGKPHGANHRFIDVVPPGTTDIDTVSFQCNGRPGKAFVELVIQVLDGEAVTIEQREWHVVPMPMP